MRAVALREGRPDANLYLTAARNQVQWIVNNKPPTDPLMTKGQRVAGGAIAQAIVTMGKQLRQEIVAEGVETREQMAFLRDLGCDQLQGYLFSKPLSADDFVRLVLQDARLDVST